MAHERTYPCLPCREIDEAIAFYEAMGFRRTYRQLRPNPYAVVQREDLQFHLFGMPEFDPEQSYGSVIVVVPDPDALYRAFAEGLRKVYNKLPIVGIPRILRPRKKLGTVRGFTIVDVGGNWLRVSQLGDAESQENEDGLAGFLNVAARLGDAHGDVAKALKTIETGLKRFPDAPPIDRARALLYRAELALRSGKSELAAESLTSAQAVALTDEEQAGLADEFAQVASYVRDGQAPHGPST